MGSSIDMLKVDLVDQLEYMARQELGPESAELAVTFLRALFADVPPSDLVPERPEALLERGLSLLEFMRRRTPGRAKVRVYEPVRPAGVLHATQTIIDIVNDDMPFLVDSIRSVLERTGSELRLLVHPILEIERAADGELLNLRVAELPTPGSAESVMHISIGPMPAAQHAELEARIESVLEDVRATVTDFEAMRGVCANQARAFRHSPLPDEESTSEIAEFLEWLCDRQFVFQGYAYVRFERAPMSMRPLPAGAQPVDDGAGVRFDRDMGLGILRDPRRSMFDVFEPPRKRELLRVLKANRHSTVHRNVHLDAIIISDLDARGGTQFGAHMFVGLFTSSAYAAPPGSIPVLHHKIERVIARTGFTPNSYNMRTLRYILETYPRNELFQISDADLFSIALGIFHLQHRQRVALFVRRDPFGRFASCLVYLPRDRMELELKRRIEDILSKGLNGSIAAYYPQLGDEPLARLHFIVKTPHGTPEKLDFVALERKIESATRTWKDRLAITLPAELGRERGTALIERYADAFPAAYREDFDEVVAVSDIERIEQALDTGRLTLELYHTEASLPHELRFKVFSPNAYVAPSVVLPILENLGLRVVGEVPYEIEIPDARDTFWLHDFSLVTEDQVPVDLQRIRESFYEVFSKTWEKRVDDDGFNKLVLHAGLTARQVALLRAYAKYLRQVQVPFSEGYMQQTLRKNAKVTRALVELFETRFDPDKFGPESAASEDEAPASTQLTSSIQRELDSVSSLDEDRILRAFLAVILATTRTNFWQRDEAGLAKDHIAFKLDPSRLPDVPRPVPFREIFVAGPRVEGVHLRFGEVARGGLRWSDRLEDFRTEVLGLAKAQQVKNAVIVPVGSKGGFVVKRAPSADSGRDALRAEGIVCYEIFVSSLLDLTDNRRVASPNGDPKAPNGAVTGDVIVPPPRTVRHDAVDPYLVVAADKGTATFSDIANRISQRRGFWLDDAFASGGSAGYDHKAMGITARGAWECVKRHFRELGKDIQREDFTCIGVGDMSGDVFGNGVLLSRHIRLVAAFDHRHIFLDPNPDAAASYNERQRLFQLDRSSWADYDTRLISAGGGIYPRTQKRIPLSTEVRALLGVNGLELDPSELIRAILKAKVELAFFGGIGTYVKSSLESDAQVGDRANDAHRINGNELGALVVGEGANLALTQRGRIEYSLSGGRCNADFIDNSAGVDCSDHEVNIKILLGDVERHGGLTREERNALLREMTDDVAALVLRDNYLQSQTLSVSTMLSQHLTDRLARTLRALEKAGRVSRRLDALPSDDELADRQRTGNGFVRPELCVLMAHSKNWLFEVLIGSDVPESPLARGDLLEYFPRRLTERYERHIFSHRLRREIIATAISNELINRVGVSFVGEVSEASGSSPAIVAQAYMGAREIVRARELWAEIEALDNRVPSATQAELLLECSRLLERFTRWLLHEHGERGAHEHVESYRAGLAELSLDLPGMLSAEERSALLDKTQGWTHVGVPAQLAERVASLRFLSPAVDIVRVAELGGVGLVEAGRLYFEIGARFGIAWLRRAMQSLPARRAWDRQALAGLRDELYATQRTFTLSILQQTPNDRDPVARVNTWREARSGALLRWEQLLGELRATATLDLSMVTVASRQLAGLVGTSAPVLATRTVTPPRSTQSLRPVS